MKKAVLFGSIATLAASACLLTAAVAHAQAFPDANLANGKEVHTSKRCAACHAETTRRDAGFMYLRDDRKVKSLFDLRRYVSLCNMELKLELFPEDERDVAAYLNQQYYKLTQ